MRIIPAVIPVFTLALFTIESHIAFGFSITPPQPGATTTYDDSETYVVPPGLQGVTFLDPKSVTSIARGGTPGFLATLAAAFPGGAGGWTFTAASADLRGSFEIVTYDAVGTAAEVGADFGLFYDPAGTDPTPAGNELHWIQRVVSNHRFGAAHGTPEDTIDITAGQGNPFYDVSFPGSANEEQFNDAPRRDDSQNDHTWRAELYLVELTAPRTVTIYNGVAWGWQNAVPDSGSTFVLLGTGIFGLIVCSWCRRKQAA